MQLIYKRGQPDDWIMCVYHVDDIAHARRIVGAKALITARDGGRWHSVTWDYAPGASGVIVCDGADITSEMFNPAEHGG